MKAKQILAMGLYGNFLSPFSVALTYIALFVSISITILCYTYHDLFQEKKTILNE